jgi:(1->4)-alpha-D-glucan 1-alpha-D-glucosylmutase
VIAGRLFAGIARAGADGVPELPDADAWRGTRVVLPDGVEGAGLVNVLTGESLFAENRTVSLEEAFCRMPWAAFKN